MFWLIAVSAVVVVLLVVMLPTLLKIIGLNRLYTGRSLSFLSIAGKNHT